MDQDEDLFEPLGKSRKYRPRTEAREEKTDLLQKDAQHAFVTEAQARGARDDDDMLD